MPRSIWTGAISFGLVTVPVKLYSAVNRKTVRFHQLNGKTGVRIQQKRVDPTTGDEVAYEDIVKGYELTPDRYVLIEPGELEALDPKKTKAIEIEDFVALDEIDPIYYDHPYYLAPGAGRREALQPAARRDARDRPRRDRDRRHPLQAAARRRAPDRRPHLGMATMVFPDEIIDADTIDEVEAVEDVEVNERELAIAEQLVESLAADFDPDKYRDTYREEVLALVERKAAGEQIAVQPAAEEDEAPVPDLMSALKASLDAVKRARGQRRRRGQGREEEGAGEAQAPAEEGSREALATARRGYRPVPDGRRRARPGPPAAPAPLGPQRPGLARRRCGRGFMYLDEQGERITDAEIVARITGLVIPPAWKDVWISPDPFGHIQATGIDEAGRKQYLYHPRWRERRDQEKFDDMVAFARALPALREVVDHDLALGDLSREQVLACAARLLDRGFFRIGSEVYAVTNETYGLATMRKEHVTVRRRDDRASTTSRRRASARVQAIVDPEIADLIATLKRRRGGGDELLAYKRDGRWCDVRSHDINAYLKAATGLDVSAKDFRTWGATVLACVGLAVMEPRGAEQDGAQARDHAGGQGGRLLPRQHPDGGAQLLHRPARLRPLRGRPDDRAGPRRDRRRPGRDRDPGTRRGGGARPADLTRFGVDRFVCGVTNAARTTQREERA